MNNVTDRTKLILTVSIVVGLMVLAGFIFAEAALGAAKFITTPVGYAPPEPAPSLEWRITPVDMRVVKALRTPPKPVYVAPTRLPSATSTGDVWGRLANCESGGNWHNKSNPNFRGGVQFSWATWRAMGGSGDPADASKDEQLMRAKKLQAQSGWGQWPACSRKLGLR